MARKWKYRKHHRRGKKLDVPLVKKSLLCTICGYRREIVRRQSRDRRVGHIKTMLCPRCQKNRRFVELF